MPTRMSRLQATRYLTHCLAQLLDPDISDERRAKLEEHAGFYRRVLGGSCSRCGRTLSDPESLALGVGPECAKQEMHV